MSITKKHEPDFEAGVSYWANTPATVNGVLGGYGPATAVPRLDASASRLLILSLIPALSTIPPVHHAASLSETPPKKRSFRALDCGAGIGRVTSTVLLPLFHRIDLVEPVESFIHEAEKAAMAQKKEGWKLLKAGGAGGEKGVRFWLAGLQHFNPSQPAVPLSGGESELVATIGSDSLQWPNPGEETTGVDGFDLVMIQWCIGHLSDDQLVAFLRRAHASLRRTAEKGLEGFIIVKENCCRDDADNNAGALWDDADSSITRSDKVFRQVFGDAGLHLIRREVQQGFPEELFPVIAYVLQ